LETYTLSPSPEKNPKWNTGPTRGLKNSVN